MGPTSVRRSEAKPRSTGSPPPPLTRLTLSAEHISQGLGAPTVRHPDGTRTVRQVDGFAPSHTRERGTPSQPSSFGSAGTTETSRVDSAPRPRGTLPWGKGGFVFVRRANLTHPLRILVFKDPSVLRPESLYSRLSGRRCDSSSCERSVVVKKRWTQDTSDEDSADASPRAEATLRKAGMSVQDFVTRALREKLDREGRRDRRRGE